MSIDRYFIKEGYQCNPVKSFDMDEVDGYWDTQRLQASKLFQYHVYEEASLLFRKQKMKSVADVGSGPALKTRFFFEGSAKQIVLFDQPSTGRLLEGASAKVKFYPIDLEDFPRSLTEHKFDLIICADVIEHLNDPDVLLAFMKCLAHENSVVVISTPERDKRRGVANIQSPNADHVREWNFSEFRSYLASRGLKIDRHFTLPIKKNRIYSSTILRTIVKPFAIRSLNETQVAFCTF